MVIITDSEQALEDSSNTSLDKNVSKESRDSLNRLPEEEEKVQMFSKHILQNRLFVGHYQERRLVEFIGTYRDVVIVHKSEMDLKRDLDSVRSRLHNCYYSMWIGITGPNTVGVPTGIAIWVKLHDLPFGHYWFQIKQVKFREREIYLRLKMIRPLAVNDPVSDLVQQPVKSDSQQSLASSSWASSSSVSKHAAENDWTESVLKWRTIVMEQIVQNFTTLATLQNIKESVCFIIAMFMATVAGIMYGIRFAGDFSIKFMREVSLFLQASTPIILGIIDFFSKIVGGLYLLLAMMWRGNNGPSDGGGPQINPTLRKSYIPPYATPYPYRALPLPPPSIGLQQTNYKNK